MDVANEVWKAGGRVPWARAVRPGAPRSEFFDFQGDHRAGAPSAPRLGGGSGLATRPSAIRVNGPVAERLTGAGAYSWRFGWGGATHVSPSRPMGIIGEVLCALYRGSNLTVAHPRSA
jgi:hypothetical protein